MPHCRVIWIFGQTLDNFLAYAPFLPKFGICQDSPLCDFILAFAKRLMESCSIPHLSFSQISHFRGNCQLSICFFYCLTIFFCQTFDESLPNWPISQFIIFVRFTSIDVLVFSHWFHFCQTFCKLLPILSLSYNPQLVVKMPLLSSHLNIWPNPW